MSKAKLLTNERLKDIMEDAMVMREKKACLEDIVQRGVYDINTSVTSDSPPPHSLWQYSILEVLGRGDDVIQRLTLIDSGVMFVRARRTGVWKSWMRVSVTESA